MSQTLDFQAQKEMERGNNEISTTQESKGIKNIVSLLTVSFKLVQEAAQEQYD